MTKRKEPSVLVLGMGRAGTAIAGYLVGLGCLVYAYDADPGVLAKEAVNRLLAKGVKIARNPERLRPDLVVTSPGISEDNKIVQTLRREGLPIVDELDLAARLLSGDIIAVTGTNGKSTTTALIAEMLKAAGSKVFVGGNLAPGRPLSAALSRARQDYYVVEVSSFQLERSRWLASRVAVLLNITPDHLNRHRSLKRYAECKFRVLDRQTEDDFAVLNRDDPMVMKARARGKARRRYFSLRRKVRGAWQNDGWLCFENERIVPVSALKLRGTHNVANALAAVCVTRALDVGVAPIRAALRRFRGLPHRLEPVRKLRRVEYVNNSMCTNPASGVNSLLAFKRKVILIAGGREKGLPVGEYVRAISRRAKRTILCGENSEALAKGLKRVGYRRFEIAANLKQAVRAARTRARPGDVVLFSPGFASFDQFQDFQKRGEAFKREVRNLG